MTVDLPTYSTTSRDSNSRGGNLLEFVCDITVTIQLYSYNPSSIDFMYASQLAAFIPYLLVYRIQGR